jgi:dethiobiotin synthetase
LWSEDASLLLAAADIDAPGENAVSPFLLEAPLAPPVAARLAGGRLEWSAVSSAASEAIEAWTGRADVMVVEGIGGLLCPIAERATVADLAIHLDFPLVIVARRGLGTLNHTLLTVEAARRRGLRMAGLVLNGAEPPAHLMAESTNLAELVRHLDGVAVLAELDHVADPDVLWETLDRVDWYGRARPPRGVQEPRTEKPEG